MRLTRRLLKKIKKEILIDLLIEQEHELDSVYNELREALEGRQAPPQIMFIRKGRQ